MSEAYVGEVRGFAFPNAPNGWMACDGRLLGIGGNTGLYSLLGTTYGGDGKSTFALPNITGSDPITGQTLHYFIAVGGIFPPRP